MSLKPAVSKLPERLRNCVTHHHACDCREWGHAQEVERLRFDNSILHSQLKQHRARHKTYKRRFAETLEQLRASQQANAALVKALQEVESFTAYQDCEMCNEMHNVARAAIPHQGHEGNG